ncbi:MAG: hypothetical protein EPN82_06035 [Bacteroidetes bacterium]|nr:MAG: hypothetical protein EPN82_06035 [Bacteroidota bacterium]
MKIFYTKFIEYIFLCFFISLMFGFKLFGQTPPTNFSPTSGSYENPTSFSFRSSINGCYLLVVSNNNNTCTTNGTVNDIVHVFGFLSANTNASYTPNTSEWNKLSNGNIYWHISWRETGGCDNYPYPYPNTVQNCFQLTKTCSNPPSSNPTNLSPICGTQIQSTSQQLSWSSVSGATNYEIQISSYSSFSELITDQTLTTNGYLLSGLTDGNTYYWRVRSGKCSNPIQWYNGWVTCSLSVKLPCTITNVTTNKYIYSKGETVTINWSASKANNFTLEINKGSGWEFVKNIFNSKSTTYTLPNQTGTGWKFRVCTNDAVCPSVVCAESNSFDISNPQCTLSITQPSSNGLDYYPIDNITLSWQGNSYVSGVNVSFSYDGSNFIPYPTGQNQPPSGSVNFYFPPSDQEYQNFTVKVQDINNCASDLRSFKLHKSYLTPLEQLGKWLWSILIADPVDPCTGNYFSSSIDLNIPGKLGISFERYYNSKGADTIISNFGHGWNHNLALRLDTIRHILVVTKGDGTKYFFYDSNAIIKNQPYTEGSLKNPDQNIYKFVSKYGISYIFDLSKNGMLQQIYDNEGNIVQCYNSNTLDSIIIPGNRKIKFHYNTNKLIDTIFDPEMRKYSYSYDSLSRLIKFTNPKGDSTLYFYSGNYLTQYIDFNSNTFITNTFDASGRVTSQINALGVNTQFIYLDHQTNVTNSIGTSQYFYDDYHRITKQITPLNNNTEQYAYTDYKDNRNLITDFNSNSYNYTYSDSSYGSVTQEINPAGQTHNFNYSNGNLSRIWDSTGTIDSILYDIQGLPIVTTDGYGNSTSFSYDSNGYLTTSKKVVGKDTIINTSVYNSIGQLISSTDPMGRVTQYYYEDGMYLTKKILPDSTVFRYQYNGNGYLTKIFNPKGDSTIKEYDANNNLIKTISPVGRTTRRVYDSTMNQLKYEINAYGDTTEYIRDAMGRLIETKDPIKRSYKLNYDNNGNVIKKEIPNCSSCGSVTNIQYNVINQDTLTIGPVNDSTRKYFDLRGNITKIVNPLGDSVLKFYDGIGRLIMTISSDSIVTIYKRNENGQIDSILYNDNAKEANFYKKDGSLDSIVDVEGKVTNFEYYDITGLLKSAIDYQGNFVISNYDSIHNKISIVNAIGDSTKMTYNKDNQLLTITDPNSNTISKVYDLLGRDSLIIDANDHFIIYGYDKISRLISVTDKDTIITSYRYMENDKIDSIIYGSGRVVTGFQYDSSFRTIFTPDPPTYFSYNKISLPETIVNANNDTITLKYRRDGKLKFKIFPNNDTVSYIYSKAGLDSIIMDKYGSIIYIYNNKRQLTSLISTNPINKSILDTILYEYIGVNRSKLILPNKDTCFYFYDFRNRLSKISFKGLDFSYTYDSISRITSLRYPNKITSNYHYTKSRLDTIKINDSSGKIIMSYAYSFDNNNNINQIIKSYPHRLSFVNQIDTIYYGNSDTVLLCSNGSFDTWLPVASYAVSLKKPILFTNPVSLDYNPDIKIKILGILSGTNKNVIIMGGPETISDEVEAQLKTMNINTSRISAVNRYALAALIAQKTGTPIIGDFNKTAIITSGDDPYNSMIVCSFAGLNGIPILLTSLDSLSIEAQNALDSMKIDSVIVVGNLSMNVIAKLNSKNIRIKQQFSGNYEDNSAAVFNLMKNFNGSIYFAEKKDFRNLASLASVLNNNGGYVLCADSSENYPVLLNKIVADNLTLDTINILKNGNIKQTTLTALKQNFYGREIDTLIYLFDNMDQLLTDSSKRRPSRNYSYDKNYNRNNYTVSGQQKILCNYDILTDRLSQFGSTTFTYDGTGNLLSKIKPGDTTLFLWDKRERLDSIYSNINGSFKYLYDALNRRIGIINVNDTTFTMYGSDLDAIMDLKPNHDTTSFISGFGIDDMLGFINNQGSMFFLKDHQGTNAGMIDINGNIIQRNDFDAFGVRLNQGSLISRFTYTGREAEPISNLYYYRARWYDAENGRFLSNDPISGDLNDPISLNKYVYVRNNGLRFVDKLGIIANETFIPNCADIANENNSFCKFITNSGGSLFDYYEKHPKEARYLYRPYIRGTRIKADMGLGSKLFKGLELAQCLRTIFDNSSSITDKAICLPEIFVVASFCAPPAGATGPLAIGSEVACINLVEEHVDVVKEDFNENVIPIVKDDICNKHEMSYRGLNMTLEEQYNMDCGNNPYLWDIIQDHWCDCFKNNHPECFDSFGNFKCK